MISTAENDFGLVSNPCHGTETTKSKIGMESNPCYGTGTTGKTDIGLESTPAVNEDESQIGLESNPGTANHTVSLEGRTGIMTPL